MTSTPAPFHPVFYSHITWDQLSATPISNPTYQEKNKQTNKQNTTKTICLDLFLAQSKPSDYLWLTWYGLISKPQWDTDHLTANKIIATHWIEDYKKL